MTASAPEPTGTDRQVEDHIGLAFGALAFAVVLGIGLTAAVGFLVRTLQSSAPPAQQLDIGGAPALTLFLGTLATCLTAAIVVWRLTDRLRNPYRQGVLAMMAFFGSFVAGHLAALAADQLASALGATSTDGSPSRIGLVVLGLTAFALAATLFRRLRTRGAG